MRFIRDTIYEADEGKVFKNINTGAIGDSLILLAMSDSILNYEEVDKPIYTLEENPDEDVFKTLESEAEDE